MIQNKLKINDDKTEIFFLHLQKPILQKIYILGLEKKLYHQPIHAKALEICWTATSL